MVACHWIIIMDDQIIIFVDRKSLTCIKSVHMTAVRPPAMVKTQAMARRTRIDT